MLDVKNRMVTRLQRRLARVRRMGPSAAPRTIVATIGLMLALAPTSCAIRAATPAAATSRYAPTAVAVDELSQGAQDGPVAIDVGGPTQITYCKITIEPGAGTGLHCHYGQLLAVVGQGVLTHYAPVYPSGVHQYVAGESLVEGASYVHEGKNEGTEDVVLWVTYVTPEGKPLSEADLAKCEQ
jgi:quercetin dioxygenase-like cupin family protein